MNGRATASVHTPTAILFCFLGSLAFWMLILNDFSRLDGLVVQNEVMLGHDFLNVWTAGRMVLEGKIAALYDIPAYRELQEGFVGHQLVGHNYSYPPLGLPLTVPFGALPYGWALAGWTIVSGAMFVRAARPFMREIGLAAWLVLLLPAPVVNLWNGHYGFLIGALWLWGFSSLGNAPRRAGIMFGLMVIKPHLGILLPLVLALRRQWVAFAAAAATLVMLVLASLLLYGLEPWRAYLSATIGAQTGMIDAGSAFFASLATSTATAIYSLGARSGPALAIHALVALFALALLADAARRPAIQTREIGLMAATATFLVLPYAFNYDLTVVSLAAVWTFLRYQRELTLIAKAALVLAFFGPQLGFVVAELTGLLVTPAALLLQLIVQWHAATRTAATNTSTVATPEQSQAKRV